MIVLLFAWALIQKGVWTGARSSQPQTCAILTNVRVTGPATDGGDTKMLTPSGIHVDIVESPSEFPVRPT